MAFGTKHITFNQFFKAFPHSLELVGKANIHSYLIKPKQSRWGDKIITKKK